MDDAILLMSKMSESKLKSILKTFQTPQELSKLHDIHRRIMSGGPEAANLKKAINELTVHDTGSTSIVERIKLSATRPEVKRRRATVTATKSLMNVVAGDNEFELTFARFLEAAPDVAAFYKNSQATGFSLEYQAANGGIIRDYFPDFVIRDATGTIWIVETKGREDIQDPRKWQRLKLWCEDASMQDAPRRYRALFVRQEEWEGQLNPPQTLAVAEEVFGDH